MNIATIAEILGLILTISGISLFANKKGASALIEEVNHNQGLLWYFGFISLVAGSVLVSFHTGHGSYVRVFAKVLGFIALIKAVIILLFPSSAVSLSKKWNKSGLLAFCGIIAFVLGLLLLYRGVRM